MENKSLKEKIKHELDEYLSRWVKEKDIGNIESLNRGLIHSLTRIIKSESNSLDDNDVLTLILNSVFNLTEHSDKILNKITNPQIK